MKQMIFTSLSLIMFIGTSHAATHKIIKLHAPGEFGNHYSLFMNNGEIFEIDKADKANVEIAEKSISLDVEVELDLIKSSRTDTSRTLITKVEIIEKKPTFQTKEYYNSDRYRRLYLRSSDPLSNYDLTTYSSYEVAQEVMDVFNGNTHDDSQCYSRAHMWTYEAFLEYGDNLGKVWMFFGNKYIREYGHKWWFHVAPYARVQGYSMPLVLDRGFTKIPYQLENWKNIFIKNEASCSRIYEYNEYTRNTNHEYCFLMLSSAYYWQPRDLEALDNNRRNFRWGYSMQDLDWSYNDALGTTGVRAPYARDREHHNAYRY